MSGPRWLLLKATRRARHELCRRLYIDRAGGAEKAILLAGSARSGTTWLADVIASQLRCRVLFEPFHPKRVPQYSAFRTMQYMRPETPHPALEEFCGAVFRGEIRGRWVDREATILRPQRRLIKEIRTNLLLRWISVNFPEVPRILVLRHPCAVVLSRLRAGWPARHDLNSFLAQDELVADHLAPHRAFMESADTPEERHAIVWCVTNLVPLRQFGNTDPNCVFYEHLCSNPTEAIPRLFGLLGAEWDPAVFGRLETPSSTVSTESAVLRGIDRIEAWRHGLSADQVRRIVSVVDRFGLGQLYDDSPLPRVPLEKP